MSNKLILGTVQFGLKYGINNTIGKVDRLLSPESKSFGNLKKEKLLVKAV